MFFPKYMFILVEKIHIVKLSVIYTEIQPRRNPTPHRQADRGGFFNVQFLFFILNVSCNIKENNKYTN